MFVEAAANMRRLFGSRGEGSRQDVLIAEEADGPLVREKEQEACAPNKQANEQTSGEDKVWGDGQTLNGFNRRTGFRDRWYRCDSEYRLAPKCPWRDTPREDRSPPFQERGKARKPSYSTISMETPVSA